MMGKIPPPIISFVPRTRKKIVKKKSLSGRVFEAICSCSGKFDKASPAKNPPISNEKPTPATRLAIPKAQAMLTINKSSCELEISFSKRLGKIFLDKVQTKISSIVALIATNPYSPKDNFPLPKLAKNIRTTMATKSCTSKNPTDILP